MNAILQNSRFTVGEVTTCHSLRAHLEGRLNDVSPHATLQASFIHIHTTGETKPSE